MIKHDFSKEYKSAKYVKKGNMDGTLSDEIYMIEAVKSSDGCSEFIWKKEGGGRTILRIKRIEHIMIGSAGTMIPLP